MTKTNINEATKEKDNKKETKYSLNVLRENCVKLYGVTSSTFDGAMAGNKNMEYTIEDVGTRIKAWLTKEVR